jgi:predicted dehydrogenase
MVAMRIVIVGCGLIGHKRAQNSAGARVVACVDPNLALAKSFSEKYGIPVYSSSLEEVLANEKVEFDCALLATPHHVLPALIKQCLSSGKHVLVEKPAARFPDELLDLIKLNATKGVKVRIGFNHRYHRAFRKAREIVNEGALGDLFFIRARYGHGGRIGYNKEWRAKPEISGGGELIDQGSHLIDLSRMFLGDFTKIEGTAKNYFWDMPVDDNAFLHLTTSGGKTAFLQVSCSEWKNIFSFEIYGRHGKLDITGLGGSYGVERLTYYKMLPEMGPPETTCWEYPMADDSWQYEFTEFMKDISENRTVSPGLKDAFENLQIIQTIYKNSGYDFR